MGSVISLRLSASLLEEIDRICREEGKSRSAFVKEALRYYLQHTRRKDNSEGFVPFLEYRKINEELRSALRRIAELEALVAELRKENETLRKELEGRRRKRWFF